MISHIFESQKVLWNPIKSHEVSWNLIKSLKSHEVVEVSESLMKSYEVPWILMESQKVLWSFSKSFGSLSKIWSLYCWSLRESLEIFRSLLKSWSLEVRCFPLGGIARYRRPKGGPCAQLMSPISMKLCLYVAPNEIWKR